MGMYRLSKTKNNQGEKAYYLQKQIIYDKTDKKTLPPYTYLPKSLKRCSNLSSNAQLRGGSMHSSPVFFATKVRALDLYDLKMSYGGRYEEKNKYDRSCKGRGTGATEFSKCGH